MGRGVKNEVIRAEVTLLQKDISRIELGDPRERCKKCKLKIRGPLHEEGPHHKGLIMRNDNVKRKRKEGRCTNSL